MDQCNSCRCNQGCNKSCSNRSSCNMGESPCQQARERAEYTNYEEPRYYRKAAMYREESRSQRAYDCPDYADDPVGCMPIAMAYVPWQQWGDVFTGECGLEHGTIFPELVKPFWVSCGQCR